MKDEKAIRLLLWSIGGSGTHYNGPAISSFRLYRRAREQGLTVSLAHAYPEQPLYPAVFEEQFFLRHGLIAAASPVGRVLPSAVRGGANTVLFSRLARSWMKRYAQRFDVFHGLSGYTPTLALAEAAVAQGLPAVVAPVIYSELVAGNAVKAALGYLRHRVAILKRVQGVIAISSDIERRLLQLGIPERNVVRIPMGGVDVAEFRPLDSATSKMEQRRRFGLRDLPACIFAGSIVRRKRPHLLVEAMGILRAKGHDCQLVLAGPEHEPDYAREMRARAAALAIEDKIAWLGFTREMAQIYPLCDMLCLPSVNEGLPGVLLEAMACGLPCIGTDVSGFRDVIDDGVNGRIVSGGAESIADAMADYFADPRLCREHGDKARRKMVADFSVERILEKYLAVFSRVVTVGEARH